MDGWGGLVDISSVSKNNTCKCLQINAMQAQKTSERCQKSNRQLWGSHTYSHTVVEKTATTASEGHLSIYMHTGPARSSFEFFLQSAHDERQVDCWSFRAKATPFLGEYSCILARLIVLLRGGMRRFSTTPCLHGQQNTQNRPVVAVVVLLL